MRQRDVFLTGPVRSPPGETGLDGGPAVHVVQSRGQHVALRGLIGLDHVVLRLFVQGPGISGLCRNPGQIVCGSVTAVPFVSGHDRVTSSLIAT